MRSALLSLLASIGSSVGPDELAASGVVFAPHPDDETLGCGGMIARKVRSGAEVRVVFMTDGTASHRQVVDAAELARWRRQEAVAACEVLGLGPGMLRFLEFRDGGLRAQYAAAVAAVEAILTESSADQLFVPYFAEEPTDHWVTREIVLEGLRRTGRRATVYEYPIWFWHHWPWASNADAQGRGAWGRVRHTVGSWARLARDFRHWVAVEDVLELKREALSRHRSQMERLRGDAPWPVLADVSDGDFLACFFVGREWFHRHAG